MDYQIGGAYGPAGGVRIVIRDRAEEPVPGKYNVCYINAFQTQPGEAWPSNLLLRDDDGELVEDPDWPGEYALDTSTKAKRKAIAKIEFAWIDDCAARGFRAIDPDNLDTYTRFPGKLTQNGNLALIKILAKRAHDRGLAIGQKNTAELGDKGKRVAGLDFAVTESCQVYDECDAYTSVYGRRVIELEYTDDGRANFEAACAARGSRISIVYRDRSVVPRGASGYTFDFC